MSLYFAVMSGRWMFLESRFLNLVQAAEVFHRHNYPNEVVPKATHKARVKQITDAAPDAYRNYRCMNRLSQAPKTAPITRVTRLVMISIGRPFVAPPRRLR